VIYLKITILKHTILGGINDIFILSFSSNEGDDDAIFARGRESDLIGSRLVTQLFHSA
jgi:hypothetical protein